MRLRFLASLLLPAVFPLTAGPVCAESLEGRPEFAAAWRALNEGLPTVAALKGERLLTDPALSAGEKARLAVLAVEGWVRGGNGVRALAVLENQDVPDEPFWLAQARLLMGDVENAAHLLRTEQERGHLTARGILLLARVSLIQGQEGAARDLLSSLQAHEDADIARQARLMLADQELAAGRSGVALERLQAAPALDGPLALYLKARVHLERNEPERAMQLLEGVIGQPGGGERVHHAAAVLRAEMLLRSGRLEECVQALIQFIDTTGESGLWPAAFDLLGQCLRLDKAATAPPAITLRWIAQGASAQHQGTASAAAVDALRGHAIFFAARWLVDNERALEALGLLEALLQIFPGHEREGQAMRLAMETYGAMQADGRVLALAELWRRRFGSGGSSMVDFVTGGILSAQGDYSQAMKLFENTASIATSLAERRNALYNACVAAFRAGEAAMFQSLLGQLEVAAAGDASGTAPADLELEKALELAAKGDVGAMPALDVFLQRHAGHPRVADAHIARAEIRLLQRPPALDAAEAALKEAQASPLTDAQVRQVAITRLWLLDARKDLKALTAEGEAFLQHWPEAPSAVEVRMRVADAWYRQGSFANARTHFEIVAKEHEKSPWADTALYFAGMAAMSIGSEEARSAALALWQQLVERKSPLGIAARQQQVLILRRDGEDAEALALVDNLLADETLADDQRRALICDRAELLMVLGEKEATHLQKAVDALQALLQEKRLPYFWRARAGFTLASALKAAGRNDEALEACYDVVRHDAYHGPSNPAEHRWYYKAGFFGIELLQASRQWEAAARLAEMLAETKGERADDARKLATDIRLEHFLWDEKQKP